VQQHGPEAGLHERATVSEICAYYGQILLADRMLESGKVEFFPGCEYVGDRQIVSRISGERLEVSQRCRDLGPGDAYRLEPGHDAWVLGDEPFVALDREQDRRDLCQELTGARGGRTMKGCWREFHPNH
jgi:hypothetical protein